MNHLDDEPEVVSMGYDCDGDYYQCGDVWIKCSVYYETDTYNSQYDFYVNEQHIGTWYIDDGYVGDMKYIFEVKKLIAYVKSLN
jgi:hypothetical protein